MARARFLIAAAVLALIAHPTVPSNAAAEPSPYRLHVQGHMGFGVRAIDIEIPWDSSKNGSPFDFTADASDDIGLERLRWVWSRLQTVPEGRKVTFETDSESIRAWREAGYLVLEPHHLDDRDDHHARIRIPDYIVNTVLDNDGRLTNRDIERLARDRGKVTLVKISSDVGGCSVWLDHAGEQSY
jgi:hypothetical protein